MPANDMTIVHLSEFHLQAADKEPTGIPYEDLLDGYGDALRTLDHLRTYVSEPDLFVVTGDLVLGSRNAEAGYPRLLELLEQFKAEFDVPVLLALGNGDATEPFRRIVLGETGANLNKRHYYSHIVKGLKVIVLDSHAENQHYGEIFPLASSSPLSLEPESVSVFYKFYLTNSHILEAHQMHIQ